MSGSCFSFKKFTIRHDRCAMKVGTDGVLLGAWADTHACRNMLDIGTGTGLIALMLAQRSDAQIEGIDIDLQACEQAIENVRNSPYSDRIKIFHTSFDSFHPLQNQKYDLLVSNPPYFTTSLQGPDLQRNLARHQNELTLKNLLAKGSTLLANSGKLALILPFDQKEVLEKTASELSLFFCRRTFVYPTSGSLPKRLLVELSPTPCKNVIENELTIEVARHQYTDEYIKLTRDFYLKM